MSVIIIFSFYYASSKAYHIAMTLFVIDKRFKDMQKHARKWIKKPTVIKTLEGEFTVSAWVTGIPYK